MQDMNEETLAKIRTVCKAVGHALQVSGPFNLQIIAKENRFKTQVTTTTCHKNNLPPEH